MQLPDPMRLLRGLAYLHVTLAAIQPVLAGQYFTGHPEAMELHGPLGEFIAWIALAQVVVAVSAWRRQRLTYLEALVFVVMSALAGLQVHAGHNGYLALHIPLGSFILAASAAIVMWLTIRHRNATLIAASSERSHQRRETQ